MYGGLEPPRSVVAARFAWLPLQYLIATAALHKLYHRGQARRTERPTQPPMAVASVTLQQAVLPAAANGGQEPSDTRVTEVAEVPVRTARRLLRMAKVVGE